MRATIAAVPAGEKKKGVRGMDDLCTKEDLTIAFATELFAQLSEADQKAIIEMTRSLLSER